MMILLAVSVIAAGIIGSSWLVALLAEGDER